MNRKAFLVSRCSWTLYNFRRGLMRALQEAGYRVIGAGAGGDGFENRIEAAGTPFHPLPLDKKGTNPVSDLKLFITLWRWYRREKPAIVHHFTIKPVIYGSIAARLAGVPKIINTITGMGYVFSADKKTWLQWMVERLLHFAMICSDITFFQNKDDRAFFLSNKLVKKEKTMLVPGSGVDIDHFKPVGGREKGDGEPLVFLMMARLLREKGIYEFVAAARSIRREYPQAVFQLLGMRDERNPGVIPEEDLQKWNREGDVSWLGNVADVRPIIEKSDVVVLPSFYREGVPRSLLEAAAMGKAVITANTTGCRDAVADGVTGLLVPPKDADALASAMRKMIENRSLRRSMGRAGRKRVTEIFNEKTVIQKTLKAYKL